MIKNILVPTDFSTASEHAFEYAMSLAKKYDATIHVAYVILSDMNIGSCYILKSDVECFIDRIEDAISENLKKFTNRHKEGYVKEIILRGIPHVELTNYANNSTADIVIIGTYNKTPVEYLVYGSTTEKLITKIKKPILVIKV